MWYLHVTPLHTCTDAPTLLADIPALLLYVNTHTHSEIVTCLPYCGTHTPVINLHTRRHLHTDVYLSSLHMYAHPQTVCLYNASKPGHFLPALTALTHSCTSSEMIFLSAAIIVGIIKDQIETSS